MNCSAGHDPTDLKSALYTLASGVDQGCGWVLRRCDSCKAFVLVARPRPKVEIDDQRPSLECAAGDDRLAFEELLTIVLRNMKSDETAKTGIAHFRDHLAFLWGSCWKNSDGYTPHRKRMKEIAFSLWDKLERFR